MVDDLGLDGRGDLDCAEVGGVEGGADVAHGGEDERDVLSGVASDRAALVADDDGTEDDVAVVADVGLDPAVRVGAAVGDVLELHV